MIDANNEVLKDKELFELSKSMLEEDVKRFSRIDERASRYLASLTVFIGVSGFLVKWSIENFIPFQSNIDRFSILLLSMFVLALAISWILALMALRRCSYDILPINETVITVFQGRQVVDLYKSYINKAIKVHKENTKNQNKRIRLIEYSHLCIIVAFIAGFLLFSFVGYKMYETRVKTVSQTQEVSPWQLEKEISSEAKKVMIPLMINQTAPLEEIRSHYQIGPQNQ